MDSKPLADQLENSSLEGLENLRGIGEFQKQLLQLFKARNDYLPLACHPR
jgi:hypothetical protein